MSKEVSRKKAIEEIENTDGKIFYTEFIKRSNGEKRKMWARKGVTKYLKGGDKPYNADDKDLITVFDMQKVDYRSIPKENIIKLSANGEKYEIIGSD